MVERRELASGDRRRPKARAMGHQERKPLRLRRRVSGDLRSFRRERSRADEDAVEAAVFVRQSEGAQVTLVYHLPGGRVGLGRVLRGDEPENLEIVAVGRHRIVLSTVEFPTEVKQ